MGTGSFPGVKRPGRGVDHPPTSSAEVKERVELYLYSPSVPSWPVLGRTLILPLTPNLCTAGGHFQGSANDKVLLSQSALGSLCWSRRSQPAIFEMHAASRRLLLDHILCAISSTFTQSDPRPQHRTCAHQLISVLTTLPAPDGNRETNC